MTATALPGGTYTMAEGLTVTRMGYGAMQLAGPQWQAADTSGATLR